MQGSCHLTWVGRTNIKNDEIDIDEQVIFSEFGSFPVQIDSSHVLLNGPTKILPGGAFPPEQVCPNQQLVPLGIKHPLFPIFVWSKFEVIVGEINPNPDGKFDGCELLDILNSYIKVILSIIFIYKLLFGKAFMLKMKK